MIKCAVITGFLSQTRDRFQLVSVMQHIDGIEAIYPYEVHDVAPARRLVEKYKLRWAAVNVNVKAEPEFVNGGITSNNKQV